MVALSCTARTLKFSLLVFNLVFLLCGLICVGIGVWLVLDKYAIDNLSSATAKVVKGYDENEGLRDLATKPTAVRQIGYILLVGGLVVIFVAFLGCCGAAKEWRPLLCCYASCLMLILAMEIAAAIYAVMHSHMFENDFRDILRSTLKMYNGTDKLGKSNSESDSMLVKTAWDKIMQEKKCCGVDSAIGEFNQSGWYQITRGEHDFPPACCPPDKLGRKLPHCPKLLRYFEGCYKKIEESFREVVSQFKMVAWVIFLFCLIQVVGIIVGFWLCDTITPEDDGCITPFYREEKLKYSAILGVLIILTLTKIIGILMAAVLFHRIKVEMLYYY